MGGREWFKNYYNDNKKKLRAKKRVYEKEYYKKNASRRRANTKEYNKRIRKEAMQLLGGKCVKCGFDDWRALQFDHINGGGTKDTMSMVGMKNKVILDRIKAGSKDYQLLCANCNWIKRYEKGETA